MAKLGQANSGFALWVAFSERRVLEDIVEDTVRDMVEVAAQLHH